MSENKKIAIILFNLGGPDSLGSAFCLILRSLHNSCP